MAAWCVVMPPAAVAFAGILKILSERCGRSGSHSAVHNGPFTVDVLLELKNDELLITYYALDEIAD